MITAQQIAEKLDVALKQFGEYTFYDKGPEEVMDIPEITVELKKLSAEDAGKIMKEVSELRPEHGKRLLSSLAAGMQDVNDLWFERMLEVSGADF